MAKVKISELVKQIKPVSVDFGGKIVELSYDMGWFNSVNRIALSEEKEKVDDYAIRCIAECVKKWNITDDDGITLDINKANVEGLGDVVISAIFCALRDNAVADPSTGSGRRKKFLGLF